MTKLACDQPSSSERADRDRAGDALAEARRLLARREINDALAAFDRAQRLGLPLAECAAGRWMCWMLRGDFERAWRESDEIAASGAPDPHRLWEGQTIDGRCVILRCLHGYGDAIQMIRYVPLLRRSVRRLIVETHPEMVEVLRTADGIDELVSWGGAENPRRWEQQIEIMELPRLFRTTVASIPNRAPYLKIGDDRIERVRSFLDAGRRPKIGLVWGASDYDPARSIPLSTLLRALRPGRGALHSLQHGRHREQLASIVPKYGLRDIAAVAPEIIDTAAVIVNLDLIVTVDTLTAHLAGALARPVWLMLPYAADWRWMLDRADSPWYPTMRIFRQASCDDWEGVIRQVERALDSHCA